MPSAADGLGSADPRQLSLVPQSSSLPPLPPLPPYTVRVSKRARRVRLLVNARDGLVVTVPTRWRGNAEEVVRSKREWAEAALASVADRRALYLGGAEALLPDVIELRAVGETWPVHYVATDATGVRAVAKGGILEVRGNIDDADACLAALVRWLDRASRDLLIPMLASVAADAGVTYASARVRHQRSRWGSCSSRATISLNRSLVFVPEHLVVALMLHELAHTRVLNHSARFWAELATLDPQHEVHRAQLRDAAVLVPAWADV